MKKIFIGVVIAVFIAMSMHYITSSDQQPYAVESRGDNHLPVSELSREVNEFGVSVITISVVDQKAVLELQTGDLKVVSIGDQIETPALQVTQITTGMVAFKDVENLSSYLVYLKSNTASSRVQVISSTPNSVPGLVRVSSLAKD